MREALVLNAVIMPVIGLVLFFSAGVIAQDRIVKKSADSRGKVVYRYGSDDSWSPVKKRLLKLLNDYRDHRIGVSLINLSSNREVYAFNANSPLEPASIMKIITSAVALKTLSPHFRFKTDFVVDKFENGRVNKMYVIGSGDPVLTVDSLWMIARKFASRGIRSIETLALDTSMHQDKVSRQGQRAFEAGTSALALNFNSVGFEVCPAAVGQRASVKRDPPEYPVVLKGSIITNSRNRSKFYIDELSRGDSWPQVYRLRGSISRYQECETIYRSVSNPERYFAEVFVGLLKSEGVRVGEVVFNGRAPESGRVLYSHKS
ncbi:MAG: hypothetical protein D6719_08045, partial [Candidatus Dadabacteria bacterium]